MRRFVGDFRLSNVNTENVHTLPIQRGNLAVVWKMYWFFSLALTESQPWDLLPERHQYHFSKDLPTSFVLQAHAKFIYDFRHAMVKTTRPSEKQCECQFLIMMDLEGSRYDFECFNFFSILMLSLYNVCMPKFQEQH